MALPKWKISIVGRGLERPLYLFSAHRNGKPIMWTEDRDSATWFEDEEKRRILARAHHFPEGLVVGRIVHATSSGVACVVPE